MSESLKRAVQKKNVVEGVDGPAVFRFRVLATGSHRRKVISSFIISYTQTIFCCQFFSKDRCLTIVPTDISNIGISNGI